MDSTSTSSGAAPAPAPSSTPFGNPTAFGPSESSGKGKTVALICTSVLACLGLAFGGFEFYQNLQLAKGSNSGSGSASQEISTFSLEVTNPDGSVAGLETDQFTIENGVLSATYNDPTVSLIINPEGAPTLKSSDYLYVGEWGIKIKKPENLSSVAFSYNNGNFCVNGVKNDGQNYPPEFSMPDKNSYLACVSRGTGESQSANGPWWEDPEQAQVTFGDYYYWTQGSQAVYSTDESEQKWEQESRALIVGMLTDPLNYSAI